MSDDDSDYGLSPQVSIPRIPAPDLPWQVRLPREYRPRIGLIGAGGIAEYHLRAYRSLGLDVACIANRTIARAGQRRDAFYPDAAVTVDYRELLKRDDIEVVDITLPPEVRSEAIEAALLAGKHVLSQKPFAVDLDEAERLVALADKCGRTLAVNQNGRWAPHVSFAREAVRAGLLGEIATIDLQLAFDHSWTTGTPFEEIHHLVLYDFGVHWFDMAACYLGESRIESVFASTARAPHQAARPPFLATAILSGPEVQARISFNAATTYGQSDRTLICGSRGTLHAFGPSLSSQQVVLSTPEGECHPELSGTWFTSGFQGAMAELLCAIEEGREPTHSARNNLRTLEFCFAALASAEWQQPVRPGDVRWVPENSLSRPQPS